MNYIYIHTRTRTRAHTHTHDATVIYLAEWTHLMRQWLTEWTHSQCIH